MFFLDVLAHFGEVYFESVRPGAFSDAEPVSGFDGVRHVLLDALSVEEGASFGAEVDQDDSEFFIGQETEVVARDGLVLEDDVAGGERAEDVEGDFLESFSSDEVVLLENVDLYLRQKVLVGLRREDLLDPLLRLFVGVDVESHGLQQVAQVVLSLAVDDAPEEVAGRLVRVGVDEVAVAGLAQPLAQVSVSPELVAQTGLHHGQSPGLPVVRVFYLSHNFIQFLHRLR